MTIGFAQLVIVASVLIALAAALSTNRALRAGSEGTGLLVGVGVGLVASLTALALVGLGLGPDRFAALHLIYGIATIGLPLAAVITLVTQRGASTWFRVVLVCLTVGAPLGIYASFVEPFWLRADRVEVPLESAVPIDVKVGVLADLQTDSIGDYEQRAIDRLLEEEPDIVLIPGDFWQMSFEDFRERAPQFAAVMQRLSDEVPHVAVVRGDSDRQFGLRVITEGTNVVLLDNETIDITVRGAPIRILGVSLLGDEFALDFATDRFFAPATTDPVRIVLSHRPGEIERFSTDDDIDLVVAGHTHGGQVSLPFFGPPFTNSIVPRSVAAGGLHRLDGHAIYVSTGVGRERRNAPRVRFGVRPSIGVLTLTNAR